MESVILCDSTSRLYDRDCSWITTAARNMLSTLEQNGVPGSMVYISTCDVYGLDRGENITEETSCEPVIPYAKSKYEVELMLKKWCAAQGVKLAILRAPHVVGTGMGGEMRRLVNRIYRCTYRHVGDDDARVSTIHATSLAQAAVMAMGHDVTWNVTDNHNPTMHELSEALAWRLDNKRIYSLTPKKARIMARIGDFIPVTGYDSAMLQRQLDTLTFSGTKLADEMNFKPVCVVEYLRNHIYDEQSL